MCEKAFVMNYAQAEELVRTAREAKLMLMEAMWNRFHPINEKIHGLIDSGSIGEVTEVLMLSGVRTEAGSQYGRMLNPKTGGGALLDFGCYAINDIVDILGENYESVEVATNIGSTGVDVLDTLLFRYANGKQGVAVASCSTNLFGGSFIYGTDGFITKNGFTRGSLVKPGCEPEIFDLPFPEGTTGYEYELRHFIDCVQKNLVESPRMPHSASLAIMKAIDAGFEQMKTTQGFISAE
jgi:predicted dehydrogenase